MLKLDPLIIVTQNEEQLLRRLLVKQLQVDLEDDLKQAVVGRTVPANVRSPHVDQKHVGHRKRKQ